MNRIAPIAFILLTALFNRADFAQSPARSVPPAPIGLWLTQDHDGVIAIAFCDDGICARIVGIFLDHANDPTPLDFRGVSQCGLPLITDARQTRAGRWKGHILDPRNGSVFGVELWPYDADHLALHGFLGFSLLGRTETWTRYSGPIPSDCRLLNR